MTYIAERDALAKALYLRDKNRDGFLPSDGWESRPEQVKDRYRAQVDDLPVVFADVLPREPHYDEHGHRDGDCVTEADLRAALEQAIIQALPE